jgi:LysR family transcriptional regulator, glycine cleavage system transcriptional activator
LKRLPPLKSIQAFRYAAEALSFKVAAERLHVTPTAVSQQIKNLEQDLGVMLFKRKTREVELTSHARQLLPYISKAFLLMEEGVSGVVEDPHPTRLTITVLPSFSSRFLIPRLVGFQQSQSEINIHLLSSLGLSKFENNDLDLAIRFGEGRYPGLVSKHVLDDYVLPVCHPSLIDPDKPIKEQLEKLPVLRDDINFSEPFWEIFQDKTGVKSKHDESRLQFSDATMLVESVLASRGLALLRYSLAYDLIEQGSLICPLPVYLKSQFSYHLVAPELNFERSKVKKFERWLRQEVRDIEESWSKFYAKNLNNVRPLNSEEV